MRLFRILHHWLVPHEGNNHRAKVLHHESLLGFVLLFAIFNLAIRIIHVQVPDILGYATDIRVEELLAATNAKRIEAGLSSLSLSQTLSQAASAKAADMFANNYWAHTSPSGKSPWDFIVAAGYRYILAGENLAKNFQTSDGVVEAWMASPTHRDNIVKPGYQEVGYAVVNGVLEGEETTLVVQMFGTTNTKPIAQAPRESAAQVAPTSIPTPFPSLVPIESTLAPEVDSAVVPTASLEPVLDTGFTLQAVSNNPRVDLTTLSRFVTFVLTGLLIGVFAADAYVVSRRRIVRLVGHNLTHIFFLMTIVTGGVAITRGALI